VTDYFAGCIYKGDVTKRYRELALKYHPDLNKDPQALATMQIINEQVVRAKRWALDDPPGGPPPDNPFGFATKEEFVANVEQMDIEKKLAELIEEVSYWVGVRVERIGDWLWVYDAMPEYHDRLRELKFSYSKRLSGWYYMGRIPKKKQRGERSEYSLDDMRRAFGKQDIEKKERGNLG
jgi:hypothetical protein